MRGPVQETKALRHGFTDVPAVPGHSHAGRSVVVQQPITGDWIKCPRGDDYTDAMAKAEAYVATLPELKGYTL